MAYSRRSRRGSSRRLKNEMNVVPYIDVMLVLLVIFMVTTPLITSGTIHLPTVGQAATVPAAPIEVQIDPKGMLSVRLRQPGQNFQDVTQDTLVTSVQQLIKQDNPVVIAADGQVPYEDVMKVMDKLRTAGITKLGLLVSEKQETNSRNKSAKKN